MAEFQWLMISDVYVHPETFVAIFGEDMPWELLPLDGLTPLADTIRLAIHHY